MNQDERSERSRTVILQAALDLFSHQGYRGTSIREISERAAVSTGSVYHHFRDKESIFTTLLQQFWDAAETPDFPLNKAILDGAFPTRMGEIGRAAGEVLTRWRQHVALMYVDAVEFEGKHLKKFYADMGDRCRAMASRMPLEGVLRDGVSPTTAMLMTIRIFIYYFVVEHLFNVPNNYGVKSDEAVAMIGDVLQHGMLRSRHS